MFKYLGHLHKIKVIEIIIRSKLEISIDIFHFNHHPETGWVNIAMEKVVSDVTVNVRGIYELGKKKIQ